MSTREIHPLVRLETLALIAIGGFAGANVRWATASVLPGLAGTLAVNVAGSLALGFVVYEAVANGVLAAETRVVVATGFLASLTTYSTFALGSALATPAWMIASVVANYALGIGGVVAGRALALHVDRRWG